VLYKIGAEHAFRQVLIISDGTQPGARITVTDLDGEILLEHTRPEPGIRYVGNGRSRGRHPKHPRVAPMS
jgi:putative transposase